MNIIKSFVSKYTLSTHSLAVAIAALVTLYAAVPAFHDLVFNIYSATPPWFHEIAAAAFGIYAFYSGASNNTKSVSIVQNISAPKENQQWKK